MSLPSSFHSASNSARSFSAYSEGRKVKRTYLIIDKIKCFALCLQPRSIGSAPGVLVYLVYLRAEGALRERSVKNALYPTNLRRCERYLLPQCHHLALGLVPRVVGVVAVADYRRHLLLRDCVIHQGNERVLAFWRFKRNVMPMHSSSK